RASGSRLALGCDRAPFANVHYDFVLVYHRPCNLKREFIQMGCLNRLLSKSLGMTALAGAAVLSGMAAWADDSWHQAPFHLKSGDRILDTNPADPGGHAGPYLADVDNDGRRDLVV